MGVIRVGRATPTPSLSDLGRPLRRLLELPLLVPQPVQRLGQRVALAAARGGRRPAAAGEPRRRGERVGGAARIVHARRKRVLRAGATGVHAHGGRPGGRRGADGVQRRGGRAARGRRRGRARRRRALHQGVQSGGGSGPRVAGQRGEQAVDGGGRDGLGEGGGRGRHGAAAPRRPLASLHPSPLTTMLLSNPAASARKRSARPRNAAEARASAAAAPVGSAPAAADRAAAADMISAGADTAAIGAAGTSAAAYGRLHSFFSPLPGSARPARPAPACTRRRDRRRSSTD